MSVMFLSLNRHTHIQISFELVIQLPRDNIAMKLEHLNSSNKAHHDISHALECGAALTSPGHCWKICIFKHSKYLMCCLPPSGSIKHAIISVLIWQPQGLWVENEGGKSSGLLGELEAGTSCTVLGRICEELANTSGIPNIFCHL